MLYSNIQILILKSRYTHILKGEDEGQHQARDQHDHAEDEKHPLVRSHVHLSGERTRGKIIWPSINTSKYVKMI